MSHFTAFGRAWAYCGRTLMNPSGAADTQLTMASLDVLLKQAARAADWRQAVVHRCAWCGRVAKRDGDGATLHAKLTIVTTDGMCEACGRKAMADLIARRARRRAEVAPAA